jgi:transposase-like protein
MDEVVRLYGLGLTMAEIANLYGVSAWIIASRLDQAGVRRRRTSDPQAALPIEKAVASYHKQPHRLEEFAADLGISAGLIVDRAQRPGRGRRGLRRDRADVPASEVADLYQAEWTVTQIAASYRTTTATVLRRLDQAGIPRRPRTARVQFPVAEAARRVQQERVSFAQLARDYGVGVDAVRGQLRARGICAPPTTGPRVLVGVPATQIAGLYAAGLTMAHIAARLGVSPDTIRVRLLAAGVTPRRVPPPDTVNRSLLSRPLPGTGRAPPWPSWPPATRSPRRPSAASSPRPASQCAHPAGVPVPDAPGSPSRSRRRPSCTARD